MNIIRNDKGDIKNLRGNYKEMCAINCENSSNDKFLRRCN